MLETQLNVMSCRKGSLVGTELDDTWLPWSPFMTLESHNTRTRLHKVQFETRVVNPGHILFRKMWGL